MWQGANPDVSHREVRREGEDWHRFEWEKRGSFGISCKLTFCRSRYNQTVQPVQLIHRSDTLL